MQAAKCSPITGPSLNPCPDPPPAIHTFCAAGCRSMIRWPSGLFSYWQTRDSSKGAARSAGNRRAITWRARARLSVDGDRLRSVGSIVSPRVSSAILRPTLALDSTSNSISFVGRAPGLSSLYPSQVGAAEPKSSTCTRSLAPPFLVHPGESAAHSSF